MTARPDLETIEAILQHVADRHGDPTGLIYAHLFAAHPDLEKLFAMDRDGGVRASMVQTSLECILDFIGSDLTATNVIAATRMHHEGYGVPDGRFDAFWTAMTAAFREVLADDWTSEMDRQWSVLIAAFAAIV